MSDTFFVTESGNQVYNRSIISAGGCLADPSHKEYTRSVSEYWSAKEKLMKPGSRMDSAAKIDPTK